MSDLRRRLLDGDRRALARAMTRVERGGEAADALVRDLYPHTGRAHLIGMTGPPGAGKSTLVTALAQTLRRRGETLGIVAVDPSSPFTGGALLGDRVRMRDLYEDDGVFIRSMASRGRLGGLSLATADVAKLLDAAGFDRVIIETVGTGQAEVDIATLAHTTIVIEAPGMGDDIQSIKAGVLEIADILVVNKADLPFAANTVRALHAMLSLGQTGSQMHHGRLMTQPAIATMHGWKPPIVETVASQSKGVDKLADAIDAHRDYLRQSDGWAQRESQRSRQEVREQLQLRLIERLAGDDYERLIDAVTQREISPVEAAERLLKAYRERKS